MADVWVRSPSALSERFDDVTVVLDHLTGRSVRLNAAAGCVWEALEHPVTTEDVGAHVAGRFALAGERALADAAATLAGLQERGLVTRSAPPAR